MAQAIALHTRPHYRIDNRIVDEYGAKVGAIGIAIYNVLARYADRATGVAFPSIGTIATKLKLGRTTVKKYLHLLLRHGLIAIDPRYSDAGDLTSNRYTLLDGVPGMARRDGARTGNDRRESAAPEAEGGRSPADPPPCPTATDPRSPADPEQSSSLNKKERTSSARAEDAEKREALARAHQQSLICTRQHACAHPADEIVYLSDGLIVCNHCYSLLDEPGGLLPLLPAPDRAA